MNFNKKSLLLLALIASMAGLTACSQTHERTMSRSSEVRGYEDETTGARQTSPTTTTTKASKQELMAVNEGQPFEYYQQEFNRLGYKLNDITMGKDYVMYDLRKDNKRFLTTLHEDDNNRVSRIDVIELQPVAYEGTTQTGTTQKADTKLTQIRQEISNLPTGKKAVDYLPMLSKHGEVTEYDADENSAEAELKTADNHYLQIHMNVDPQRKTVTQISVERETWGSML